MYARPCFELNDSHLIKVMKPNFGYNGFSEYIFYKHYSRLLRDDLGVAYANEDWHDCVIRVINGTMSIRKSHYENNHIVWHEDKMQQYALRMAESMFRMEWLPPGRGLWAMGSDVVYERGAMPLYNCAYSDIGFSWVEDLCFIMDGLMNGVGVGFGAERCGLQLQIPWAHHEYVIPDSREGWVESIRQLLNAFWDDTGSLPTFDYSIIRPKGSPIKTFGGVASGPEPLMELHDKIVQLCTAYAEDEWHDEIKLKTDIANLIGVCVISGNVRRSAEIACGEVDDEIFWSLKNYAEHPDREAWGWMSNNSVRLRTREDFERMGDIAYANIRGHDLGYLNMRNFKHGRIGKFDSSIKVDQAVGINPCGEIPLEHREVCNLSETLPTRCSTHEQWLNACEYATFYCSTVTLLPTHQPETNAVINRNRRIGVSLIDFSGWKETEGTAAVTRYLREGYDRIRAVNKRLAAEAGVPESIRVTTVKPGGTVPKMAARTSGACHPTFRYTLRRVRVGVIEPIVSALKAANVPYEKCVNDPERTLIFEFPIEQGPACPATEVSIWEQAMNVVLLQREWADNAVSNTLYFKPQWVLEMEGNLNFNPPDVVWIPQYGEYRKWQPLYNEETHGARYTEHLIGTNVKVWFDHDTDDFKIYHKNEDHEENDLEPVLSSIAPLTKSVSLLPHTLKGIFPQMPEEGISEIEYYKRLEAIKPIDWSTYFGGDGVDEKYCDGDTCTIRS